MSGHRFESRRVETPTLAFLASPKLETTMRRTGRRRIFVIGFVVGLLLGLIFG